MGNPTSKSEHVVVIPLGTEDELVKLYSYPNGPNSSRFPKLENESLRDTILYWFNQTLTRDGYVAKGASANVVGDDSKQYDLCLTGSSAIIPELEGYKIRYPKFLDHGREALKIDREPDLEAPEDKGRPKPPYSKNWRFFLSHGLPMLNQRSLQYFHYPPARLLESYRDYLDDPVPKRWEELLIANNPPEYPKKPENVVLSMDEVALYEVVIDGCPVAAPDDQGNLMDFKFQMRFEEYQKAQIALFLNANPSNADYTIPIVVYGYYPGQAFGAIYLGNKHALGNRDPKENVTSVEIITGKKTAVLGTGHPYAFFPQAQTSLGSGYLGPGWERGIKAMIGDLTVARWQREMYTDPSRDPVDVYDECKAFWTAPKQKKAVCALVLHQGSLVAGVTGDWSWKTSLEEAQEIIAIDGLLDYANRS